MHRLHTTFVALAAVAVLAGCSDADPVSPTADVDAAEARNGVNERDPGETIVDIASGDDRFETLVAAVQTAGFVDLLNGRRQFTVFAPTDAAFEAFLSDTGLTAEALLAPANRDLLRQVLAYHVVPGRRDAASVVDSDRLRTQSRQFIDVVLGDADEGLGVFLGDQDPDAEDPEILIVDLFATNGVVHAIDRVLRPVDL